MEIWCGGLLTGGTSLGVASAYRGGAQEDPTTLPQHALRWWTSEMDQLLSYIYIYICIVLITPGHIHHEQETQGGLEAFVRRGSRLLLLHPLHERRR